MKRLLQLFGLLVPLVLGTPAAKAAWMGLDDGDHVVSLQCTFSSQIPCPSSTPGTMTLQGGEVTAFDFTIDGQHYLGDPGDHVSDGTLVDTENSTLVLPGPFNFLSLRLITDGSIGGFVTGDRWWVYCNNFNGGNTCTPNTTGLWSARLVGTVGEPASLALMALALPAVAARAWRRRRVGSCALGSEPPRLLRRLLRLRRWSHHEEVTEVFPRGHRTRGAHGVRRQGPATRGHCSAPSKRCSSTRSPSHLASSTNEPSRIKASAGSGTSGRRLASPL